MKQIAAFLTFALLLIVPAEAQSPFSAFIHKSAQPATQTTTQAAPAAPAAALPAQPGTLDKAQAQQILDVLNDDAKRAQFTATLQSLITALPQNAPAATPVTTPATAPANQTASAPAEGATHAPAAAGTALAAGASAAAPAAEENSPFTSDSLVVQVLDQSSNWLGHLSLNAGGLVGIARGLPDVGRFFLLTTEDPGSRDRTINAVISLAIVMIAALALEWLVQRFSIRWYRAAGERSAQMDRDPADHVVAEPLEPSNGARKRSRIKSSWRLLRRLPLVLLRFVLDLVPVIAFAILGNFLLSTGLGSIRTTRLVVLAIVNAYVACRVVMCVVRMLVSPGAPRLRLIPIGQDNARLLESWLRRVVGLAIFGVTLIDAAQLLGLSRAGHDTLGKLLALVVHALLIAMVLKFRKPLSAAIRSDRADPGFWGVLRNRLAEAWPTLAIIVIVALWFGVALGSEPDYGRFFTLAILSIAVLIAGRVVWIVLLGLTDRLLQASPHGGARHGAGTHASRLHPLVRKVISVLVALAVLLVLLQVWGFHVTSWFRTGATGGRVLSALLTIGFIFLAAFAVWDLTNAAMERHILRLSRQDQIVKSARWRTLQPIMRTILAIVIIVFVGLTALSEIGVNIAPLLAGAGIIGVGLSFGSQKLVQDFITGIFLLLENAMQVGDWVTVAGVSGVVEDLSIRTVRLRAGDGSVHIIPFSSVTSVNNTNKGQGNADISVSVAYSEDTDRVSQALKDIAAEMRQDPDFAPMILQDFALWGVNSVEGSVVTIVGRFPCTTAGRWGVFREFNRRMKKRFQEMGIVLANPTQSVVVHKAADEEAKVASQPAEQDTSTPATTPLSPPS
ncbi:Mechanosensitive ion channel [Faunimonas pinastri]|uniref:Mechanosensitive ion channel n=1 Tax=Faunimonas pinastri TaxID=1855383 RepID=A0A1H9NT28_9HYPH|nr:mechanosensitive ion channel domain-containing protein [Faunimonas pinastri]SER39126.1 Mechanosensitive ion channel [Faunimonas pinastri]